LFAVADALFAVVEAFFAVPDAQRAVPDAQRAVPDAPFAVFTAYPAAFVTAPKWLIARVLSLRAAMSWLTRLLKGAADAELESAWRSTLTGCRAERARVAAQALPGPASARATTTIVV